MKIPWILTTSDNYLHLLPEFALHFNKNVGTYKVDVLCFNKPEYVLPNNFNIISLGKQSDFGRLFTDPLIPYFSDLKSKFFFHILEDYWVTKPMNHKLLKNVFKYCIKNKIKLSKVDLYSTVQWRTHAEVEANILLSDQNVGYRSSLQCALWRTDYWRKLLKPGRNIWQFEKKGSSECLNDGAFVFGSKKENQILYYHNSSHRGKMKDRAIPTFTTEQLQVKPKSYEFRRIKESLL